MNRVREAAAAALDRVLPRTDPEVVVPALWRGLLTGLGGWRMTVDVIGTILRDPRHASGLAASIAGRPAGPAATVLLLALPWPWLDVHLPRLALSSVQPAVRARAYAVLLAGEVPFVSGETLVRPEGACGPSSCAPVWTVRALSVTVRERPTLHAAAADPGVAVRRRAADHVIAHRARLGPLADVFAARFAADPAPSVAERGRFLLRQGACTGTGPSAARPLPARRHRRTECRGRYSAASARKPPDWRDHNSA